MVGGSDSLHPPDIYLTGHSDGRVRLWDVAANTPSLLFTVPFDSGGAGAKLRAVSALKVSPLYASLRTIPFPFLPISWYSLCRSIRVLHPCCRSTDVDHSPLPRRFRSLPSFGCAGRGGALPCNISSMGKCNDKAQRLCRQCRGEEGCWWASASSSNDGRNMAV